MDTAALKLGLKGSIGLLLLHSGSSRPSVLPNSGTGSRHDMLRVVGETGPARAPLEKASHPLSTGQQAEDSFICSLPCSDRLLCERRPGYEAPLAKYAWHSEPVAPKLGLCFQDPHSLRSPCTQVRPAAPGRQLSPASHSSCSPHPNPHPLCTMGSVSLCHLPLSTIPAPLLAPISGSSGSQEETDTTRCLNRDNLI